ncbi:gap junction delta-3 protein [Amia ocellicauda]|uniref:gap junction delta-3 protein n=1 Tax=Amia ocellicauda TaxID=2972642 RepID=UPI003463ACC0
MAEWVFLGALFETLQGQSPMLGRFWLLLMLVFRILILGTVATDMFEDEQAEFACNTLQPGCKQACYDMAFPISQYRFWVFHIVLISTPSLLFVIYTMHLRVKRTTKGCQCSEAVRRDERLLYIVNVGFRMLAEVGFLVGQWHLYGFKVESQFPCSRFPCPYTVDCFTSRPMEKTIFLCFYFGVGVLSTVISLLELLQVSFKWACQHHTGQGYQSDNLRNLAQEATGQSLLTDLSNKPGPCPRSNRGSKARSGSSTRSTCSKKSCSSSKCITHKTPIAV